LDELNFNPLENRLILLGDMVNKGPKSHEVLALAKEYKAHCVRGNHEDILFQIREKRRKGEINLKSPGLIYQLERSITEKEWTYLESCPLVLQLPTEHGSYVAVHAAIDYRLPIHEQDPDFAMYIPWLPNLNNPKRKTPSHRNWQNEWEASHAQVNQADSDGVTVIYGHDGKKTITESRYSFGIDTNCVSGGRLTAFQAPSGKFESVDCPNLNMRNGRN
ncbi:Metallo-dependent phosphatase-like protein, partial [Dimargaris cristalligena]